MDIGIEEKVQILDKKVYATNVEEVILVSKVTFNVGVINSF